MTKVTRVVAAIAAVCPALALHAVDWGADNVAVLSTADATETLSGEQSLKGVNVTAANVTLAAEDGASLALGACGLTNSAAGTVWGWPATLGAVSSIAINNVTSTAQTWYNATGSSLAITAPITGTDIYFQGRGRVDVYCTNNLSRYAFVGGNNGGDLGRVQVWLHPGSQLVKDGGTVDCSCTAEGTTSASIWGVHLNGVTNDCNFLVGTHNAGTPSGFFVEAGTTNLIKGSYKSQWANQSTVGIAGHLTIQGGVTITSIGNPQGRWCPFGNDSTFANGYLKVENKPMTVNRLMLQRGTLELAVAGNKAVTRGLFISGGLLKTSVADAFKLSDYNKVKMTGGTWDLCGNDQGVQLFCGNGGTVTSETAATLHMAYNDYFYDYNAAQSSSPALGLGTNATVCTTAFAGGASLSKEGTLDLYIATESSSTGTLAVTTGRLIMSRADINTHYPGTTITRKRGSWPNASAVEVRGGTLVMENEVAFGARTPIYAMGGTIELPEGVSVSVVAVRVTDGAGGWTEIRGSCGGPDSSAAVKPKYPGTDTYVFSGTGVALVGASLPDGWPAATTEADWTQQGADSLVATADNWDPATANVYDGSLLAHFASGAEASLAAHDYTYMKGVDIAATNFTFLAGEDTTLFLGALGLTNTVPGVTWGWPVSIGAFSQVWWVGTNSTMDITAPISGSGDISFYGRGRVDVYSTNALSGVVHVGISNDQSTTPLGEVSVYLHPGARLVTEGATINIACRNGWGLHLMGNTIDGNVVAGTQNAAPAAALFVEEGTTNVINGFLNTQFANESPNNIAGHLTVRGGMRVGGDAAMGRWRPFGNGSWCDNGYLKVVDRPLSGNRIMLERGTLELAVEGNTVSTRGLFISGKGRLKTSVADAFRLSGNNKVKMTGGTWDLCGKDQGVSLFCGNGGTVTSETAATLHVAYNNYFFDANSNPSSNPALGLGTNATVCTTVFAGGAGLSKEGTLDLYIAAVSGTTGTLAVANGRLIMSREDGTAKYTGTAFDKTLGSWPAASAVTVTGGVLVVEHATAFGRQADMTLGPNGTLDLDYSGVMRIHDLYLLDSNGVPVRQPIGGTWGAVGSGARHTSSLITGTGQILPVGEGLGATIIIR